MNMLLTSNGLTSLRLVNFIRDFRCKNDSKTVTIITVNPFLLKHKFRLLVTRLSFMFAGFSLFNIYHHDLAREIVPVITPDLLFVSGGNSFELLHYARITNLKSYLFEFFKNEHGLYVGSSAGSILLASSLLIASQINPDTDHRGLSSYAGLNFTSVTIFPHYHPRFENQIKSFEKYMNPRIVRLKDGQGLYIKNEKQFIV